MGKDEEQVKEVGFRDLLREACLGYAFWSLFHGLGPMIWFYPLNELAISGYESFCLIWLCPILTGFEPVMRLIQHKWTMMVLRVCVLVSLASYQAPSTLSRLAVLSFGNGAAVLVVTATLWSKSRKQRCLTFWGLVLGFFFMLVARIFFTSFCPTWWSNTSNTGVITVVAIATIDKFASGDGQLTSSDCTLQSHDKSNWLFTSLGFGSLLFLTHWIYSEVSLLSRWTVTGYPNTGPSPHPWGLCVLAALTTGSLVSFFPWLRKSIVCWVIGAVSFALLYVRIKEDPWLAFTGGLLGGVYVMLIWPELVDRVMTCPPGRTMFVTMLCYICEILFSVWTTAYNFVPGGEYTRQHTDYLLGFIIVSIAFALYTGSSDSKNTICMSADSIGSGRKIKAFLVVLFLAGGAGMVTRLESNSFSPPSRLKPHNVFRAAIWTVHFGYDNKGWPSLERAAQLLNNSGADVITLLESDASKPYLGNNDLGMWLGERLSMYVDFGPSTQDHTWGNLLLSKYPFVKSRHHLLPSPYGELAPAITATVNMSGHLVDFVVTHMGNDRDVYDRELQAKFLAKELKKCENPTVFLGYITSAPGSRDYDCFIQQGDMKDIDDTDTERWCEYIMYKKLVRLGYARVSHGGLSDTELQLATFKIPQDLSDYKDNHLLTTDPSKVSKQLRFSSKFGSHSHGHNWSPVHKYHMSTPKYFLP